jgi:UDP-N-acetylmuramyl pentapeptide synthase
VAREKGALVEGLRQWGTAVLNADDARVLAMRERLPETCGAVLFGTTGVAQVRGVILSRDDGSRLEVKAAGTSAESPPRDLVVDLPFPGRHNALDALAALACAHALGRDIADVGPRLASAKLPGRRLERVRIGPCEVLDDAYNANPASVAASLEVLAATPAPRVFVFGGMRELGAEREALHQEVGRLAAKAGLAMFWAIGPDAAISLDAACVSGLAPGAAFRADDAEAAADAIVPSLEKSGGCVLVKGSRAAKLERFIDRLRARLEPAQTRIP